MPDIRDKLAALESELIGDTPDARLRRTIRAEVDRRIWSWVGFVSLIALLLFAIKELDAPDWALALIGLSALVAPAFWEVVFDRQGERHLIGSQARAIVELRRAKEKFASGEEVWGLERHGDRLSVALKGWWGDDDYWQEVYDAVASLAKLRPYQRERMLRNAAKEARPVLEAARQLASDRSASLPSLVKEHLQN